MNWKIEMPVLIEQETAVSKAIEFAKLHHSGQTRKFTGRPYVIHPFRVYKRLVKFGIRDEDILVASVLHDVIEDTKATYADVKSHFNKNVADIVDWLTIKGGKATYIKKMIKNAPYGAVAIKTFDRIDNLNDAGDKAFVDHYKMTTDIIRSGLKKRGFTDLYNEFMKTYSKVYESSLVEARIWDAHMLEGARHIFAEIKWFTEKHRKEDSSGVYAKKGKTSREFEIQLKDIGNVVVEVEIESIPDAVYAFGISGHALPIEVEDFLYEAKMEVWVNPTSFPEAYNDLNAEIRDVLRHEVEHIYQGGKNKVEWESYGNNTWEYLLARHETPAFITGLYQRAKFQKISMNQVINNYLDTYDRKALPPAQRERVYREWVRTAKKQYPKAVWE